MKDNGREPGVSDRRWNVRRWFAAAWTKAVRVDGNLRSTVLACEKLHTISPQRMGFGSIIAAILYGRFSRPSSFGDESRPTHREPNTQGRVIGPLLFDSEYRQMECLGQDCGEAISVPHRSPPRSHGGSMGQALESDHHTANPRGRCEQLSQHLQTTYG